VTKGPGEQRERKIDSSPFRSPGSFVWGCPFLFRVSAPLRETRFFGYGSVVMAARAEAG
jgi:hypothetical protein